MEDTRGISFAPIVTLSVLFLVSAAWQIIMIFQESSKRVTPVVAATAEGVSRAGALVVSSIDAVGPRSRRVTPSNATTTSEEKTGLTGKDKQSVELHEREDDVELDEESAAETKKGLRFNKEAMTKELTDDVYKLRLLVVGTYLVNFAITLSCGIVSTVVKPKSNKMMVLGYIWAAVYLVFMLGTSMMKITTRVHLKIVGVIYCLTYVFVLATLYMFVNSRASSDSEVAAFYNTGSFVPTEEQLLLVVEFHWLNNIVMILGIAFYVVAASLISYAPEVAALLVVGGYSCLAIIGGYFAMIAAWVFKAKEMSSTSTTIRGHEFYGDMGMVYFWCVLLFSMFVFLLAYCKRVKSVTDGGYYGVEIFRGFNKLMCHLAERPSQAKQLAALAAAEAKEKKAAEEKAKASMQG